VFTLYRRLRSETDIQSGFGFFFGYQVLVSSCGGSRVPFRGGGGAATAAAAATTIGGCAIIDDFGGSGRIINSNTDSVGGIRICGSGIE
jgi:hypothetical protein